MRIPEMLRVICAALLLLLPVVWAVPSLVLDYQSGNFLYAVHSRINDGGLIFPVPDVFPSEWDVVVLLGEGEKRASFISICKGHDAKNSLFESLIMKQPVREGSWGMGFLKDGLNAGYFEISEADLPRYHVRGRCYSRSEAVFRIYPNGGSFSINLEAKVQP